MILEKFPAVQALGIEEKWRLMAELWIELSADVESVPARKERMALLEERFAEYLAHPDNVRSWEEVRQSLASAKAQWK